MRDLTVRLPNVSQSDETVFWYTVNSICTFLAAAIELIRPSSILIALDGLLNVTNRGYLLTIIYCLINKSSLKELRIYQAETTVEGIEATLTLHKLQYGIIIEVSSEWAATIKLIESPHLEKLSELEPALKEKTEGKLSSYCCPPGLKLLDIPRGRKSWEITIGTDRSLVVGTAGYLPLLFPSDFYSELTQALKQSGKVLLTSGLPRELGIFVGQLSGPESTNLNSDIFVLPNSIIVSESQDDMSSASETEIFINSLINDSRFGTAQFHARLSYSGIAEVTQIENWPINIGQHDGIIPDADRVILLAHFDNIGSVAILGYLGIAGTHAMPFKIPALKVIELIVRCRAYIPFLNGMVTVALPDRIEPRVVSKINALGVGVFLYSDRAQLDLLLKLKKVDIGFDLNGGAYTTLSIEPGNLSFLLLLGIVGVAKEKINTQLQELRLSSIEDNDRMHLVVSQILVEKVDSIKQTLRKVFADTSGTFSQLVNVLSYVDRLDDNGLRLYIASKGGETAEGELLWRINHGQLTWLMIFYNGTSLDSSVILPALRKLSEQISEKVLMEDEAT